jgi:phosphatidate cytidylyltransferase
MPEALAVLSAPAILAPLAAAWAFLLSATGIVAAIARGRPTRDTSELWDRTRTWWWIIGIVSAAMLLGPKATILLTSALSFLAFREFHSIVPVRRSDRVILGLAYLAIPVQFWLVWTAWYGLFTIFLPVYAFTIVAASTVCSGETRGFIRSTATLHWALMLTVYNLSHLAYLTVLPLASAAPAGGVGVLLFVLIVVQFNDVAQFVWGRSFGRRKIVPSVSPGKTWEGFIGGAVTTAGLSVLLAPWLVPFDLAGAASLGLLLAMVGFFGDVTLSAVKRDLGIKDTGSSLPGHGGVLDRLDSLTLSAPIAFHIIRYFYGA